MPHKVTVPHPSIQRIIRKLGENIRLTRQRGGMTMNSVAERAGLSRATLRAAERGEARVTIGSYRKILISLGLDDDISGLVQDNEPDADNVNTAASPVEAQDKTKSKIPRR